jgi:hypothetical protein
MKAAWPTGTSVMSPDAEVIAQVPTMAVGMVVASLEP